MRRKLGSVGIVTLWIAAALATTAKPAFAGGVCAGDCDGDQIVAVYELVRLVRFALGHDDFLTCPQADSDGDQLIGLVDVVRAVGASLGPCSRSLAVHGRCVRPGQDGLVACDAGEPVRVLRCDDLTRCLTSPDEASVSLLTTAQIDSEGRFMASFPPGLAGTSALILEAQVDATTTYRTIVFRDGASGAGSGLIGEDILIGPSSEAAVRLMAESGFSSFSADDVADLVAAVEAANEGTDFSSLTPQRAAMDAEVVAAGDADVMMILEQALHTPTPTSSPSATPNLSDTPTRTPTATRTPTTSKGGVLLVTKSQDSNDGVCDADCSLREAIAAADANPGPDEISVAAGTYRLTVASSGRTRLFLTTDVNIVGAGRNLTIIDGNDTGSVFAVQSATVRIADLTVTNGTADLDDGGGIFNAGTLTLERVSVVNNIAVRFGGGIFNSESDSLTVRDSVVTQNRADRGGGIYNDVLATLDLVDSTISSNNASRGGGLLITALGSSSARVNRCTIHGNAVTEQGGGVFGQGTFINATISGNSANGSGGGIFVSSVTTLSNVTVTDNFAQTRGGGISGTATIANTLIAGNRGAGNCNDTLTSRGHNLVVIDSSSSGCELDSVATGDITADVDPGLGPLADNGGPTMTHALLDGSPALDAGDPSTPGSGEGACELADQRGIGRPVGSACDIGAWEGMGPPISPTATPTPTLAPLCATCCEYYVHDCPQEGCGECDPNADGLVTTGELSLLGCNDLQCPENPPTRTPTPTVTPTGEPCTPGLDCPPLKAGDILIADPEAEGSTGAIIKVDPVTGEQTVLSSGQFFVDPRGVAVDRAGQIFVADPTAFGDGAILRIDPASGEQSVVTAAGFLRDPLDLVFDANGQLIVADAFGTVLRIDPLSGAQGVVSSGGSFQAPHGVAVDSDGSIIVSDLAGTVFRVDPSNGSQTPIASGGDLGFLSVQVEVDSIGNIYVASLGRGVVKVDPNTGVQELVLPGGSPSGIVLDPAGNIIVAHEDISIGVVRSTSSGDDPISIASFGFFVLPRGVAVVSDVEPPPAVLRDRQAFLAAVPGALTIDFEGLAAPLTYADFGGGLTVSGVDFLAPLPGFLNYLYVAAPLVQGYTWGTGATLLWGSGGYLLVTLPPAVNAVGFDLLLDSDTPFVPPSATAEYVVTLDSGHVLRAENLPFPLPAFFGIVSSAPISSMRIELASETRPPLPLLDNFTVGSSAMSGTR